MSVGGFVTGDTTSISICPSSVFGQEKHQLHIGHQGNSRCMSTCSFVMAKGPKPCRASMVLTLYPEILRFFYNNH